MSLLAQDTQLTRRVGAVTLVLLAAATIFIVFIYDRIEWGSSMRIRIYFASTGSIAEGAVFVSAGRDIGRVESITLLPRGATHDGGTPTPLAGDEGIVVTVKLDRDLAAITPKGGDIFVTSRGMLSVRYLELGPPPAGTLTYLRDGDEFRGKDPPSLDRVLQRTWVNLGIARQFAEEIRPEARALADAIDQLQATLLGIAPQILFRDDFDQLFEEAKRSYAAFGGDPGIVRMRAVIGEGTSTLAQARASIAKLRVSADMLGASVDVLKARLGGKGAQAIAHVEAAIDRIKAAAAKIDPLLATVEEIQQRIERGEGSLLKLARDPEFPEDAKELGKILKRSPWKVLDRPPN
jgi:hypothetical protein